MTAAPPLAIDKLAKLESYWRAQGAPIAQRLRAGLSERDIDQLTGRLGLRLPVEARTWWGWHDGASAEGATTGFERWLGGSAFEYLSLEEAAAWYDEMRGVAADVSAAAGNQRSDWWEDSWFPITKNMGGGTIACDCAVPQGAVTPIRMVDWARNERFRDPVVSSLGEVVEWWIEALDGGAWRYDAREARWQNRYDLHEPARELTGLV